MKSVFVLSILLSASFSYARNEVNIINNLKTKKLVFNSYLEKKLKRSSKLTPMETSVFPERVTELFEDFSKSLPQGYLADFNQDGKKDVVFLSKYKTVFRKKVKGVVFAAISTSTNVYKLREVARFDLFTMKDSKLTKSKNETDDQLLMYLVDPNPGALGNKTVVLETYMEKKPKKFRYERGKFTQIL